MLTFVSLASILILIYVALNRYALKEIYASDLFSERQKHIWGILIWIIPFSTLLPLVVINQAGRAKLVLEKPSIKEGLAWTHLESEKSAFVRARPHVHDDTCSHHHSCSPVLDAAESNIVRG